MRRGILTRRLAALAAATVMLASSPGRAQDDYQEDFARIGFYGTAYGAYAFEFFEKDLSQRLGTPVTTGNSWGAGGALGYRLLPFLGLELGGEWMNDFTSKYTTNSTPGANVFGDTDWVAGDRAAGTVLWNVTANAKGYVLTGRIQPYGMIGLGYGQAKTAPVLSISRIDRGFVARFGIGSDVMFTEEVGLNLAATYVMPTGDLKDFDYLALQFGFVIRFLPQ